MKISSMLPLLSSSWAEERVEGGKVDVQLDQSYIIVKLRAVCACLVSESHL